MRRRRLPLSLLIALAAACPAVAATTQPAGMAADVPVRAVTLYTSGVGFFRHEGTVRGDGDVTLKFKTQQINDVIKSLVVQDDGGSVSGVQYPSQDPLDKTLKTFQIDLTGEPSLAELFSQLRGAKVTVELSGDTRHGTVVGVEKKTVPQPTPAPPRESATLTLFEGAGLSQIELESVKSIKLDDAKLADELTQALAAVAAGRDQDKKPVTVHFTGAGEHRMRLGYVVETPVWKVTYRLLLNDAAVSPASGSAATNPASQDRLQGWAVVENQTDFDWRDVSLSLVSGRPISFAMDLYQPLYLQRPVVEPSLFRGLAPQVYQEGMQNHSFAAPAPAPRSASGGQMDAQRRIGVVQNSSTFTAPGSSEWAGSQQDSIFQPVLAAKLGALFRYTIDHVSLPRQQSSLVPIVTDAVQAEPLSIYNQTVLPRNPLAGVMLTNNTGKLLPQGPITVLSSGAYAGDARIEDLPAGEKRLLSFGVDLEMLVDVTDDGHVDQTGGKIVKGVLTIDRRRTQGKTYAVQNKGDKDRTVVVEHMLLDGWKLVETPEPMEKTDRRYRFRLPVAEGKTATLKVTQQNVYEEGVALLNGDFAGLVFQGREGALPDKVRAAVAEAVRRRQAVTDLEQQAARKGQAVDAISVEQQRLRENMKVIDQKVPYYDRLLTKLNDQETKIEALQTDRDDLTAKAQQARAELETYLNGLSVQ